MSDKRMLINNQIDSMSLACRCAHGMFSKNKEPMCAHDPLFIMTRAIWSCHVILNSYKLLLPSLHRKASPVHTKPCISHQRKKLLWLWDDTEARKEIRCNNVSSVNRLQCIFPSYFARGAFDIANGKLNLLTLCSHDFKHFYFLD